MFESWRVAQLVVDREGGHDGSRGSGYLVAPGRVLTAAHVVAGASAVRVRLDVGQDTEVEVRAETWWADPKRHHGTDLAVVTIPIDVTAGQVCEPALFGRISDSTAVLRVQALGFPRFKLRGDPGDPGQLGVFRDFEQATGHTPVAANRRQGTLAVYLDDPPPSPPAAGEPSPWEGMSGGAVWAAGRIVAVVAEHHPSEGTGRLTARRIDRAYEQLPAPDLGALVELLSLTSTESELFDAVPAEPSRLVRSAYLAQVRDIAPDFLIGRDSELDDWAEFCAGAELYAWWQAGPWTGKSALAAWFVTHPPAGIDIVSFFITSRLPGQADSDAFLDAMIEQLNALDPAGEGSPAVAGARTGAWLNLLASAAARAGERARRLVIVIDGLDEDDAGATPSRGRPSIASLLPRHPPAEARFIITSRPDPGLPDDLKPMNHPLRACTPRSLAMSWVAEDIKVLAKQELRDLLAGDQVAVDVVGCIAGSGGGLTRDDLSALTGAPPYKLDSVLGSVFGRSLHARVSTDPRNLHSDPAARVYLFAHETLRVTAEEQLGSELASHRQKVHEWIDTYADSGWPDTTPGYAIRGYARMLAATNDATRLSALARNPRRHAFLLRATGSDYVAVSEIRTAQSLIVDHHVLNLQALVELAIYRHAISIRNQSIPADLPVVWGRLARFDHAEALVRAITDLSTQSSAFVGLATAAVQAGDPDRAEALVRAITAPDTQARALLDLATTIAQAGYPDRAEALTDTIADAREQSEALTGLATAAAQAGDPDRAYRLADRAEALARTITDPGTQAWALAGLATVIAQAGDRDRAYRLADRAEALARTITDPDVQAWAVTGLATAIAEAGNSDRAEALIRTIADPGGQAQAFSKLVDVAVQACNLDHAEALARTISDPALQAWALAGVATAIAEAGDPDQAEALAHTIADPYAQAQALGRVAAAIAEAGDLDRAEALAGTVTDPGWALIDLVPAIAQAGDPDRAETLVRAITDPDVQADALTELVPAIAEAGDPDRAEVFADTITDPDTQAEALTRLAAAAVQAGDPDRAQRLASRAEVLARTITDPEPQAEVLTGLAAAAADAGDPGWAEALVRAITDPDVQAWALSELATVIAEAGDPGRAEVLARTITDPAAQTAALAALAPAFAQAGDPDRAEALANTITDPGGQVGALTGLATAIAQAGGRDRARRLADRAAALADTITDSGVRVGALASLAPAFAQVGDPDRAEALADTIAHPGAQAEAFTSLISVAAQAGDRDRALRLADRAEALARTITNPGAQAWALAALAPAIAEAGDPGRAEALADTITDPYAQARALTNLAEVAAQAGNPDHAVRLLTQVLVMDPPQIGWVGTLSDLYPSVIEDAWNVLVDTYTSLMPDLRTLLSAPRRAPRSAQLDADPRRLGDHHS
jgi:tetratricopeptide (TPR) repeat protein